MPLSAAECHQEGLCCSSSRVGERFHEPTSPRGTSTPPSARPSSCARGGQPPPGLRAPRQRCRPSRPRHCSRTQYARASPPRLATLCAHSSTLQLPSSMGPPEKIACAAFGRPAQGGGERERSAVGSGSIGDEFAGGVDLAVADADAAAEGVEGAAVVPVAGVVARRRCCLPTRRMHPYSRRRCSRRPRVIRSTVSTHSPRHGQQSRAAGRSCGP